MVPWKQLTSKHERDFKCSGKITLLLFTSNNKSFKQIVYLLAFTLSVAKILNISKSHIKVELLKNLLDIHYNFKRIF